MDRLLLVFGGLATAGVVAALLGRGRKPLPAANTSSVPSYLNRHDFDAAASPWLVVVFTARSCATCAGVMEQANQLASDQVAVQEIEFSSKRALHKRYRIDAVPLVVIANETGVVQQTFVGPTGAADLAVALAELRKLS